MRLKHVLFSSLFLSAAFVACTNEELIDVQTPSVNVEDAISLGEGVTISAYTGADTKAYFDKVGNGVKGLWEDTDEIGAAWYNKVAKGGINDEGEVVTPTPFTSFQSNERFAYDKAVGQYGAQFVSWSNIMAGAYVLYYPYNSEITEADYKEIPVKLVPAGIDCAEGHAYDGVNKNIFAYTAAAFVPGGNQTHEFELTYAHTLYSLQFNAENLKHVGLTPSWTIKKVILEAKDASGSVLSTTGKVTMEDYTGTPEQNNKYKADWKNNPLPAPKYESTADGKVDHFTFDVANSDQAAYRIDKLDQTTEAFVFSALPFIDEAESVTVKIQVEDQAGNELVFARTYEDGVADDQAVLDAFNEKATVPNKVVAAIIRLDTQVEDNVIYTAVEFKKQWEAAVAKKGESTLIIGDPLTLDMDLVCENPDANIKIVSANPTEASHKLIVNSINMINGDLDIETAIDVKGDVTTTAGDLIATGLMTAKNISIVGGGELNLAKMESLYVGRNSTLELTLSPKDPADIGTITVEERAELTLNGGTVNNIVNKEGGKIILAGDVTNAGTYTGVLDATSKTFTNKGIFEGSLVSGSKFTNEKDAVATFNGETGDASYAVVLVNKAGGVVSIEMPEAYDATAQNYTTSRFAVATGSENAGTINVVKGALSESAAGAFTQKEGAVTYVEAEGGVYLTNWNAVSGWVVLNDKDATLSPANDGNTTFSVKDIKDLNVTTDATYQTIDAPLTLEDNTAFVKNTRINANLTLKGAATSMYNVFVDGNVRFDAAAGVESVSFKLNNPSNAARLYVSGHLTLGKGVELGSANSDKFGSADDWKNTTAEEGATISLTY